MTDHQDYRRRALGPLLEKAALPALPKHRPRTDNPVSDALHFLKVQSERSDIDDEAGAIGIGPYDDDSLVFDDDGDFYVELEAGNYGLGPDGDEDRIILLPTQAEEVALEWLKSGGCVHWATSIMYSAGFAAAKKGAHDAAL